MSRGWRDLVAMALNAVLGIWGFFLQEKPEQGNMMIRLAFGKITFVSKKDC